MVMRCWYGLVFWLTLAFASASTPWLTGLTFMKLGVGARPVAMGGAFTAVADDASALFYNPAGIGFYRQFDVRLTMMQMFNAVSYLSGGVTAPVWKRLAAGMALGFLSASDIRRDENGEELGTFGLYDLIAGPGLAWQLFSNLAVGGAGKFVYSKIDSFSAWTLSFDGGLLYQPVRYLTIGASLLHFGPPRRFISEWEYPPANLRSGVAFKLPLDRHYLLLTADGSVYPDYGPNLSLGGEGKVDISTATSRGQAVYIRAGYQTGFHLGIWSGFSLGIGYEYPIIPGLGLTIDAVYLSYGLLGNSERVSLGLKFIPSQRR